MSNPNVEPDVLSMLEEETGYVASQKRANYAQRVKIPKGNEWRIRFLPVEQGPRRTFWARYAFHWINNRPTLCVRHSSPDFGGLGRDAACALCNVSEKLNEDQDTFVSNIGYRASAVTQWLLYCLVYEKDDGQNCVKIKEPDLFVPWEFWLTRASFEDLSAIFKKGLEYSSQSFMDLLNGNDFWVTSKKNGLRFTSNRPTQLVEDARYDDVTARIWGNIKFQVNKAPSTRDLELAARKLEEYAMTGDRGSGGRDERARNDREGRGERNERADDRRGRDDRGRGESDDYRPSRSSERDDRGRREDEPRGRSDDRGPSGPPHHDDDQIPMDDSPRDERRDERREPDRRPTPAVAHSPAPPSRPSAPPSRPAPQPAPAPPMASRPTPPPPASRNLPPPPASRTSSGAPDSSIDEEEHVPEERRDPAPPQAPENVDDTPPPVAETGASSETAVSPTPPPRSGPPKLSDRLRNGINAADRRS